MRCQDARRLLDLYIDSELDARESLEVAEHLERCAACARRFSAEEKLEGSLRSALTEGPPEDAALWARLEGAVRGDAGRVPPEEPIQGAHRDGRRRPVLAALVLASALLLVASIVLLRPPPDPLGALGKAACHSHDAYCAANEPAEVTTTSPAEVAAFFARTLGIDVRAPDEPLLRVVGARRCNFGPTVAAFVMGRRGLEPVSAFIFPARDLDAFPEARRALSGGSGPARVSIHGHEVILATDGVRAALILGAPAAEPLEPLALAFLDRR